MENINYLEIPQITISYSLKQKGKRAIVRSSIDAANVFRTVFDSFIDHHEEFYVLYLSRMNRALGVMSIGKGGISECPIDIKIIMQGAIKSLASSVILCHNHPSGSIDPSPQDDFLTRKVKDAGKILDIQVNDHIILTDESYYSYADEDRIH